MLLAALVMPEAQLGSESRRQPRAEVSAPAELHLRLANRRSLQFVTRLRSISVGGAGVTILTPGPMLVPAGAPVRLELVLGRTRIELPGQVAWCRPAGDFAGLYDIGLRLWVELAPAAMREVYLRWCRDPQTLPDSAPPEGPQPWRAGCNGHEARGGQHAVPRRDEQTGRDRALQRDRSGRGSADA